MKIKLISKKDITELSGMSIKWEETTDHVSSPIDTLFEDYDNNHMVLIEDTIMIIISKEVPHKVKVGHIQ